VTPHSDVASVLPWAFDLGAQDREGLTRRLKFEVTPGHPLWELDPSVIGRSAANDDVVAALNDGRYAIVHVVWGESPGDSQWPATYIFSTAGELSKAMHEWSREAGFLDE
jgi:hypothetical protein